MTSTDELRKQLDGQLTDVQVTFNALAAAGCKPLEELCASLERVTGQELPPVARMMLAAQG